MNQNEKAMLVKITYCNECPAFYIDENEVFEDDKPKAKCSYMSILDFLKEDYKDGDLITPPKNDCYWYRMNRVIKLRNPYSLKAFTPLSDDDLLKLKSFAESQGWTIDRISAWFAKMGFEACEFQIFNSKMNN